MLDKLEAMACGGCGEDKHKIFVRECDYYVECVNCGSVTKMSVEKPRITLGWTENSNGQLCKKFWN